MLRHISNYLRYIIADLCVLGRLTPTDNWTSIAIYDGM